jgi:hypothetical protein
MLVWSREETRLLFSPCIAPRERFSHGLIPTAPTILSSINGKESLHGLVKPFSSSVLYY